MYIPNFISSMAADRMFRSLWNELNWERRPDAPRREYWTNVFNRDYTYGRGAGIRTYTAQPTHSDILAVGLELLSDPKVATDFEGCFLNGYEGARDWLGWHSDDDPSIDHSKPIAIVTLYSDPSKKPRAIQFRDNATQTIETVELGHGSLYLMAPGFQFTHQHRIPKAGFDCADRISLTWRGLI
ncbi:MAG TPA: alpha-ketoglutarate-dependent dioxygenase AlkB [Allocoleopsis sp.]